MIQCRVQRGPAPQTVGEFNLAARSPQECLPGLGRKLLQGEVRTLEHEAPLLCRIRAAQPIAILIEQHGVIGGPATAVGKYLEHTAGLHVDEQQAQIAIPQAQAFGNTDHGIEGAIDHPLLDIEIKRRDVNPLPGQRHGIAEIVTILFVLQLVIGHTLQMLALTIEAHQLHAIRCQPAYLGIVRIAVHQHGKLGGNVVTLVATRRLQQDGFFRHAAHMAQRYRQFVIETTAGKRQEGALIATYTVELALDQCVTQQIPTH